MASVITLKNVARILTETIDIDRAEARARVSEAVNELGIDRVKYHEGLSSWMIAYSDGKMLVNLLADRHLEAIG